MLRQLNILLDELALDERGVSDRIRNVLIRNRLRIAGAGRCGDRLLVFCEPAVKPVSVCRIAPFDGFSPEELQAEVRGRFDAGFTTAAIWEYAPSTPWQATMARSGKSFGVFSIASAISR